MFTGHRDSLGDEVMLENIAALYEDCLWLHGGAHGFDEQIEHVAQKHHIQTRIYKPDYQTYTSKNAPIVRNKQMLSVCDLVIACYNGRKTGGTHFVVTEARKTGKKIIILSAHRHISTPSE
jgi:hypothetical protein